MARRAVFVGLATLPVPASDDEAVCEVATLPPLLGAFNESWPTSISYRGQIPSRTLDGHEMTRDSVRFIDE